MPPVSGKRFVFRTKNRRLPRCFIAARRAVVNERRVAGWLAYCSSSDVTQVRSPVSTILYLSFLTHDQSMHSWAGPCAGLYSPVFFCFLFLSFLFSFCFFSYLLFKLFRDFNNLKFASFQKKCLRNHKKLCEFKTKFCRFKCLENHKKFADSKNDGVFAKLFTKL
mgnify:CR=1 FL=1